MSRGGIVSGRVFYDGLLRQKARNECWTTFCSEYCFNLRSDLSKCVQVTCTNAASIRMKIKVRLERFFLTFVASGGVAPSSAGDECSIASRSLLRSIF